MLSWIFLDFFFQYYDKAHKNIAYLIENKKIESIKAKRINKKNFKKYTTANMKTIIEEINKVTKSKNEKLTEIIQKAM